jgi:protoporphyrinogen oxidase
VKRIAIIGAGISGLTTAYYLGGSHKIDIYEKTGRLGGLAKSFKVEDTYLEIYFHHFFKSDKALIELLEDLGLAEQVIYKKTNIGIYYKEGIKPFSTFKDLLLFRRLSFLSKIIFGLHILFLRYSNKWSTLENYTVQEWMQRYYGKKIYNQVWEPLLYAKFGEYASEISMSWLWGRIHPRAASREGDQESLGYLKGGFAILFDSLLERITSNNGTIFFNSEIKEVRLSADEVLIHTNKEVKNYDLVIMAIDSMEIFKLIKDLSDKKIEKLKEIEYFGVICLVLKLKHSLGKIYWLNNAEKEIPISGIIEHTNFIPSEYYNGYHIAYIFRYLSTNDRLFSLSKTEIYDLFCECVKRIYPHFNSNDIADFYYYKSSRATPVYRGRYSDLRPSFEIIPEKLYMINTSQIYPYDRNINNGVQLAKSLVNILRKKSIL